MVNGKPSGEYSDVSSEALSEAEPGEIQSDESLHELSDGEVSETSSSSPPPSRPPPAPPRRGPVGPPVALAPSPPPSDMAAAGGVYRRSPTRSPSDERPRSEERKRRRRRDRERGSSSGSSRKRRRRSRYSTSPDGRLPSASPISSDGELGSPPGGAPPSAADSAPDPVRRRPSLGATSPVSSISDSGMMSPNGDSGLLRLEARREPRDVSPSGYPPAGRSRHQTPPLPPTSAEKRRHSRERSHDRERRKRSSPLSRSRSRSPRSAATVIGGFMSENFVFVLLHGHCFFKGWENMFIREIDFRCCFEVKRRMVLPYPCMLSYNSVLLCTVF